MLAYLWNKLFVSAPVDASLQESDLDKATIGFYGDDILKIEYFVHCVKAGTYTDYQPSGGPLPQFEKFCFGGKAVEAIISPGNRGGRRIMRNALCRYDGVAFFIDTSNEEGLSESVAELRGILSEEEIVQPVAIFYREKEHSQDSDEMASVIDTRLGDAIKERNGRVATFSYCISPDRFQGCLEGVKWLLDNK